MPNEFLKSCRKNNYQITEEIPERNIEGIARQVGKYLPYIPVLLQVLLHRLGDAEILSTLPAKVRLDGLGQPDDDTLRRGRHGQDRVRIVVPIDDHFAPGKETVHRNYGHRRNGRRILTEDKLRLPDADENHQKR